MRRQRQVKRYAIYLRCSTDDQKHGDYTTIDSQRDANTRYVKDQGGVLVGEYNDEGRTGTNLNRPAWKRLLRDAAEGHFDRVAVTYMSRLGRGPTFYVAEYLLKDAGAPVDLVAEQFSEDLAGQVDQEVRIFVDGMYPKMVAQWTRTKMAEMVSRGYVCGNFQRLGYRTEYAPGTGPSSDDDKEPPKVLVLDEGEAEIVRQAFDLYAERRGIAPVQEFLNRATSRHWSYDAVKRFLQNELYIGNYVFGSWRNDGAHPAIIQRDVWDEVQRALEAGSRTRGPRSDDYTYYLRGLVFCPHCECPYTNGGAKGMTVRYYECYRHKKRRTKCPVGQINADALHASVLREIQRAAEHHTVMHRLIAESGGWQTPGEQVKALRGQLARRRQFNQVQIDNVTKAIAAGGTLQSLLTTLQKLEAEREEICAELDRVEGQIEQATVRRPTAQEVQEVWSQVAELWEFLEGEERRQLVEGLVEQVEVHEKGRASMRLRPITEGHGLKFGTSPYMGAGTGFEPATFRL